MTAAEDARVDHYRCPYCSAEPYTSPKEREVRVHIELASDGDHGGREGFSPLTHVEAVDAREEVVEEADGGGVKRDPEEFAEVCEPDDDLTATERRIVATKMMHLDYSAEEVAGFLAERGDGPSEEYVRETLRNYFGTTDTARGVRSYEEFSERQQAAIDAAARHELGEFETQAEAADAIDERVSYLRRCKYVYEDVVDRRMDVLDADDNPDAAGGSDDAGTIRRENGTGAYVGSEKGIDATMQHISERPVVDDPAGGDSRIGATPVSDVDRNSDPEVAAVQGRVEMLRRLVVNDELDAEAAFDEVERILADAMAT